jgi:hypothetical protein
VRDEMGLARANEPLLTGDLQRLRYAVGRGRPFGGDACTKDTAERLGLQDKGDKIRLSGTDFGVQGCKKRPFSVPDTFVSA